MDEKILAALSTTEKDFNSIWAEELDLTKTLTNRWDPSQSNESDPGVVLLKELAILGDKLNYNIDKNVLECFPLSVTQLGNARMLYDELGYKMHWYKSGIGQVAFKLKKSLSDLVAELNIGLNIDPLPPVRAYLLSALTDLLPKFPKAEVPTSSAFT